MSEQDPREAIRARAREDVRDIFARVPEVPLRTCPHCGEQARTRDERCPACKRSYFEKPDRFSVRTRRILQAVAALAAALVLALIVVVLSRQAHDNGVSARARRAAAAATERARLTREQRPHHALAAGPDRPGAPAATRLRLRRALVASLEALHHDRRARARRAPRAEGPQPSWPRTATRSATAPRGDELDLRKALGRYACEAGVVTARNAGITSTLGVPFVGTIDFARGRLTWCKDNPASASDVQQALAFVRLARECTAARGPVFGSGYLIEPRG